MTASGPGEPIMPSSGRVQTRGEAARCVVAAYEKELAKIMRRDSPQIDVTAGTSGAE
jgi:hypothetical protein